jgi:hypothetical protein
MRKVMAIGFLPTLVVRANFTLMRNSRRTQRLVNHFPKLGDWLDYVQLTYVNQNAVFLPASWNVFDRKMRTRTNNHIEGNWVFICTSFNGYFCVAAEEIE